MYGIYIILIVINVMSRLLGGLFLGKGQPLTYRQPLSVAHKRSTCEVIVGPGAEKWSEALLEAITSANLDVVPRSLGLS